MNEGNLISRLVKESSVEKEKVTEEVTESGHCYNWDDVEKIWHHLFYNEIRACPEEHAIVMSVKPLVLRSELEKTVQVMFETFEVPSLMLVPQDILTMIGTGRMSGIVVDSGQAYTTVSAIHEMTCIPQCTQRLSVAGSAVTATLQLLIVKKYPQLQHDIKTRIADDIKEKLSYVALNYEDELAERTLFPEEKKYELPDGQDIYLNTERFVCCEALFAPEIIGYKEKGLPDMIVECLANIKDPMVREEVLQQGIICAGGSTMFPGFADRLKHEMTERGINTKIVAPPERKCSTWIGGSIASQLAMFKDMFITKEEYDEFGPTIAHMKSF